MLFACNPNEDQPGGNGGNGGNENGGGGGGTNKSNERTILSIGFDHQIGDAIITPVGDDAGTVEFQLAVDLISDLSKVEITTLTVSYGATATAKSGDKIDFTADKNPTITVTAESGKTREYELQMSPFAESFAGCYAINSSMILGGLGEVTSAEVWGWGTLLLIDPAKDTWNWAKWISEGYGPSANYDNYLEIKCTTINDDGTTEGTCINYGGADKKHWNCFYDGAQNKEKPGQDLDLRHFYRVIPIGESTWKKDYQAGTITFFDADGNGRACVIFEDDIEICAAKEKVVDVTDQCFAFAVDGNIEWNSDNGAYYTEIGALYHDYLKFVIAPRYYFLLVSKVDEIPAESKFIGDEGDTTIEVIPDDPQPGPDPEPEFTLESIPGNYMVKSLKILGGGRGGFDEIKSKPWDWTGYVNNDSPTNADKEYDNTLVVSATGVTGTLNYGPGEDGEYWDYVYHNNMNGKNNDFGDITVDMSFNFGQLPHGESTFALDAEHMIVAITAEDKTVYGMLFGPGKQTYQNPADETKTISLTIPSGCIAIAFQLTPYSGTEYTYEDRFASSDLNMIVFHPNYYVMIFEKQNAE